MLYTISNFKNRTQSFLIASVMILFVAGCASTKPSGVQTTSPTLGEDRAINGLSVSEDANTIQVKISGNSPLRYTSVKQAFPLGIVLYFPGTKLENIDSEYPPEGELLNSIKTSQQSQASGYDSRIKILLNNDVNYDITRDDNGIVVSLVKPEDYASSQEDASVSEEMTAQEDESGYNDSQVFTEEPVVSEETMTPVEDEGVEEVASFENGNEVEGMAVADDSVLYPPEITSDDTANETLAENEPALEVTSQDDLYSEPAITGSNSETEDVLPATQIQSIDKVATEKYAEIHIGADGKVVDFDVFTIPETNEKPARIVCDIFKVKGLKTRGEQAIPVNSHGVQSVRYFSYPDKTRVVVDTTNANLNAYSTQSENNGLVIHISGEGEATQSGLAENNDETEMLSIGSLEVEDDSAAMDDQYVADYEEVPTDEAVDVVEDEPVVEESTGSDSYDVVYEDDMTTEPEVVDEPVESDGVLYDDSDSSVVASDEAQAMADDSDQYADESQDTMGDAEIVVYDDAQETMGEPEAVDYEEFEPEAGSYGESWVNRIDFSSEKDGKSAIIIGTTNQAQYKITKKDDKTIHFRLYQTKLPKSRKYPFITTRFESAVNRIIPVQTASMKDNALFIIELRESVPYYVDQQGGLIKVNFEASSIPPLPEDMANLPMWKEVLSKTTEIKDIEMEASGLAATPDDMEPVQPDYSGVDMEPPVSTVDMPSEETMIDEPLMAGADMETSESGGTALEEQPEMMEDPEDEGVPKDSGFLSWTQKKKYTGEKISVDFFDTDIKNVFRILRSVSGENFAIDKDVTGKVTMTLDKPVPWDQVLDLVLRMNMLGMVSEGGINRIATLETLKEEEAKRLDYIAAEEKTKLKKKALEPLRTEYILINYSNAKSEIMPLVKKLMTRDRKEVSISVDGRTNQIIMTDTEEKIRDAKRLIQKLDRITPQVVIEARIVEAETSFSRNLGTEWGLASNANYDNYNDLLGGTYGYEVAMNNSVASNSSIGINFTKLTGAQFLLNATLLAMESKGEGKIISAPKVMTMDNKEATITQGVEIPFYTWSANGTNTDFKRIELKLNVTPHVTSDNKISMKILIDKDDIGGVTDFGPTITTKKITSELLIGDGDTIVIGGIIKSNKSMSEEGIPFLYKLPVLGWLFKSKINSETKQELLIFLTPRIVTYEETTR